jgi:hypothetical protein
MANTSEIRDTKKTSLAGLINTKKLGGTIDDAITLQMASMMKEDIDEVMAIYESREKI